jgi:hypothetical protein
MIRMLGKSSKNFVKNLFYVIGTLEALTNKLFWVAAVNNAGQIFFIFKLHKNANKKNFVLNFQSVVHQKVEHLFFFARVFTPAVFCWQ